jgi:hypothetical protein
MVALAIGFVVFVGYRIFGDASRMPRLDLRGAGWLPPYIAGLLVISFFGRYDGGRNSVPFWWDIGLVAVFSLAIYVLAIALRLTPEDAKAYIENLDPMVEEPAG